MDEENPYIESEDNVVVGGGVKDLNRDFLTKCPNP